MSADPFHRRLIIGAVWFASAAVAFADSTNASGVNLAPAPVAFSLLRVFGALVLVVALFLGGVWLFRNGQRLAIRQGRAPKLNVLEVKSLGHRHALYVVRYEQQRLLLATSATGVTMLTHLPDSELGDADAMTQPASFGAALVQAVTRKL